jgi:hypothetical protein
MKESHDRTAENLGLSDGHFHHYTYASSDLSNRKSFPGYLEKSHKPAGCISKNQQSNQQYSQENNLSFHK